MRIDLQTLKCTECGSGVLRRTGLNQYVCEHCGSVSVVEDDISERLDRVLDQVKDAAAERLAAEQRLHQQRAIRTAGFVVGGLVLFMLLVVVVSSFVGSRGSSPSVAVEKSIPVDQLTLDGGREVLVGSRSSARPKLLVVARNETGKVLDRTSIEAVFYDGENKLGGESESLPVDVLMPGETVPVLLDLPSGDKRATRHELRVERLSEPYRAIDGPPLSFARARLVQQGPNDLRLVGRVVNTRKDVTIAGVNALVTLYDDRGAVIGFGRGYVQATELKPGERATIEVHVEHFGGGTTPIAAWDYRIGYSLLGKDGGRTAVRSAERVIRTTGGPESFNPDLRMSSEDLLADASELFDPAQLELLPLVPGVNTIRQRTYLSEVVNRSKDMIAITPAAVISMFDGSSAEGTTGFQRAYLYPGERIPVQIDPSKADRITQTRIEWKLMRKAALPGPRPPLEPKVESTRATTGGVLVNFRERFIYKAVEVRGSVKNPGTAMVRNVRLWVSLRDDKGQLTGFKRVDNLPPTAPGESVPFETRIEQQGRDFTSVETAYQTAE